MQRALRSWVRPIDLLLPCNGAFGSGTEAKGANLSQDTEARVSASHRFAFGLMNLWQTRTRIMVAVGLNTSHHVTVVGWRLKRPRYSRWRTSFLPITCVLPITCFRLITDCRFTRRFVYRTRLFIKSFLLKASYLKLLAKRSALKALH